MREHCAVSQFQPRSEVHKRNFVERNLTMALIANASVVVEAGETSGSLHQAVEALRLGRPLFIWKKVFENRALRWPKRMLDYGAIRLEKFDVVLDALPPSERVLTI
jgi:DNA processing protein